MLLFILLQSFRTEIRRDKKGIFAPCGGVKKAALKFGICCEAGSVTFCDRAGLNYVSCSPFCVPSHVLLQLRLLLRMHCKKYIGWVKVVSYDSLSCELQKVCIIVSLFYYLLNTL